MNFRDVVVTTSLIAPALVDLGIGEADAGPLEDPDMSYVRLSGMGLGADGSMHLSTTRLEGHYKSNEHRILTRCNGLEVWTVTSIDPAGMRLPRC